MTDMMVSPVEETEESSGSLVHVLCCLSENQKLETMKTLCGEIIDDDGPIDYSIDKDCERCDDLWENHICPILGICPS